MGTSQSSYGPLSGVSLLPPWVPPIDPNDSEDHSNGDTPPSEQNPDDSHTAIAPAARFAAARRAFGKYALTGDAGDLRRGLGHYVAKGLGGSKIATRRFGNTIRSAKGLYQTLSSLSRGETVEGIDIKGLSGKSAPEVMRVLIDFIEPVNGTQDSEASRDAMEKSMSELLSRYPDADLMKLNEAHLLFIMEQFVAKNITSRIILDVGKAIVAKAGVLTEATNRLKTIKNFIKQEVADIFRKLKSSGANSSDKNIGRIVYSVIQTTLNVFEEYVK